MKFKKKMLRRQRHIQNKNLIDRLETENERLKGELKVKTQEIDRVADSLIKINEK